MRRDPLIIGGGPAGSAAAITLARAGHRPILIERADGPTDKVCGDFLSTDTIQRSKALGIDPARLGAAPINRIRLICGERIAETNLPFPALGLSRRVLDEALLHQAEHSGAVVHIGRAVRRLTQEAEGWRVLTDETGPLTADTVFLATGKHDLRSLPRTRSLNRPRAQTLKGAIGMKMYFALAPEPAKALRGVIELTLFPGGYAGLQQVEHDRSVLCIAVQRAAFQHHGGNWAALLSAIAATSRRFAGMLIDARPLLRKPLAIAAIPYGYQASPPSPAGLFRLGDQAAVIPSLTGDGMAIALHSGRTAAESWLIGVGAAAYHRNLARSLTPQMRFAGLLHRTCLNAPLQAVAIRGAGLFPALMRQAANLTRLRPKT